MKILITGGVGFIGTNAALHFSKKGYQVVVLDNFSRPGVEKNAEFLRQNCEQVQIIKADVNDREKIREILPDVNVVLHLAGQTAVTTSIQKPEHDFLNNLQDSFYLLEAIRQINPEIVAIYSSTNKVYGNLEDSKLEKDYDKKRYLNLDFPNGIDEKQSLNFISPYGCSKGAADQYFLDYARVFGLKTVVFRQSCIYGQHQMGVEDQGWVAHFAKKYLKKEKITIFGDGYQVRDLLYADDLIKAYDQAITQINQVKGQAFNIGGGPENSYSLINVLDILARMTGYKIELEFDQSRTGDQKYYVSNNSKVNRLLAWKADTRFEEGIRKLLTWLKRDLSIK